MYAEGLRRGGAVVSARVADADAARLQAVIDRSAVRVSDRAAAYRKSGWSKFDPAASPSRSGDEGAVAVQVTLMLHNRKPPKSGGFFISGAFPGSRLSVEEPPYRMRAFDQD